MFQILDGSEGNVLGVEVMDEYTKADVEALKKIFDEKIAEGHDRINFLMKIDKLKLSKIHLNAFIDDSMYALKNLDKLRHIAVVGDSKIEKVLVELDNKLFQNKKRELIEKYFDVADLDKAWAFVRS
ncbi:MAG: STAS/SEC14 domain-containing protein [Deltaproteobacteria bacterium]|nr:STAS/SEC14 domain-containing protein [Deltaproteobacteria bacterium]MBW2112076.1 STAS/SEC14 domain-containing protein [Deltaproteobacteria bacterium]MBW2354380.1 STAS/SEC14 domain-containing protein [Deltaproteobacteria bacterium]